MSPAVPTTPRSPADARTPIAGEWLRGLFGPARGRAGMAVRLLLLAVLYCLTGWAGLQLAQPPGYATPVWPPSGVMLALLLLWGRRVWPGVWLGSFAVNVWVGCAHAAGVNADVLVIAALIASGSTAEGLLGALLVRRYVREPLQLESGRDVWRFYLFGGAVAGTLAATVGTGTLHLLGGLPLADAGFHWLTWWVGDSMGVFLVAPWLLVWAGAGDAIRRRRLRVVTLTVLLTVAVGAIVVERNNASERDRIAASFDEQAAVLGRRLDVGLERISAAMETMGDHFLAYPESGWPAFARHAAGQIARAPGLLHLGWVPRGQSGLLFAYPESPASLPDLSEDDDLRRSIFAGREPLAWQRGRLTAGPPVTLPRSRRRVVAVMLPVPGAVPPGLVTGVIGVRPLIADVLADSDLSHMRMSLRDVPGAGEPQQIYASGDDIEPVLRQVRDWHFGGRRWQLVVEADTGYLTHRYSTQSWLTQVGVLLFSAMLGGFFLVLTGRSARVERAVDRRTAELNERNLSLQAEIAGRRHSESSLRAIFENATTGIAFSDASRRILRWNPAFATLLEQPGPALQDVDERDLTHPDDRRREAELFAELLAGKRSDYRLEKRYLRGDGSAVWVDATVSVVRTEGGPPQHFVTAAIDISERRAAERRLRLSAAVFEHVGEAVIVADRDWRVQQVNRAFSEITGYPADDVTGRPMIELLSDVRDAGFEAEIYSALDAGGFWRGEIWGRRSNGQMYPKWLNLSAVRDARGVVSNYIAVFADISERKAAEDRMLFLAQMDALTHLPNRYLLADRLQQALESSRRSGEPFALLFIDLDRFKNINDSLGHGFGDAMLKKVAERLRNTVRASDTVARNGGDEFVVVMPGIDDAGQVAMICGKLLNAVAQPMRLEQHRVTATASIGVAMYPTDAADVESLMKHADAAMYEAKKSGRNGFRFFTPEMNRRVEAFLRVENELRAALANNELRLHYQPQYDVATGTIVGAEALIRWQHPRRGLVLPGEFIAVAEESGLIDQLGEWVLGQACRQNRAWQRAGLPRIPVAVNLSAAELHRDDAVARVERALADSGLAPRWLELEVTESMVMYDSEQVGTVLEQLRAMGVHIALDDFGTGYSSLAHLRRFPLSALKLDRSFVRDIETDSNDAAICRAVIALGRSLGVRVIAEGVENEAQLAFLAANRCDTVQGALFSWGVTAEAFAALLAAQVERAPETESS